MSDRNSTGVQLAPGWLAAELRVINQEADRNPELRERVKKYPSGFIGAANNA